MLHWRIWIFSDNDEICTHLPVLPLLSVCDIMCKDHSEQTVFFPCCTNYLFLYEVWHHDGLDFLYVFLGADTNLFCNARSMKYEIYWPWVNTLTLRGICPQLYIEASLAGAAFQICVQHIDTVSVSGMIWLQSSQSGVQRTHRLGELSDTDSPDNSRQGLVSEGHVQIRNMLPLTFSAASL